MKTITLTFMQRVRLTLMMRGFIGQRGDSRTRTIRDLRKRIGIAEEDLGQYVRFIDEERVILSPDAISVQSAAEFPVTAEESRLLLGVLNALQLRVSDMLDWADQLGEMLEAACA